MAYVMRQPDLEIQTKISKIDLVYTICDFYWTKDHRTIKLVRETEDDINYEAYDPTKKIDNIDGITEISVHTHNKKENKYVFFDSVNIAFSKAGVETKLVWYLSLGLKKWHLFGLVYLLIVFITSTYFAWIICSSDLPWHRYCFIVAFPSFLFIFIWSLYYVVFKRPINKLDSHLDTLRYRKEFEELIHRKEKELRSAKQ